MCTAATYKTYNFYFGRTLDYEFSYGERITITPRNYPFRFRCGKEVNEHYALIGMAHIAEDYPLYYEATNEVGLSMAGLNFVGNAVYALPVDNDEKDNIAVFEFIPWVLTQCSSVKEAEVLLRRLNLTDTPFNSKLGTAQLHWIIADQDSALTVESVQDGLKIYPNPVGVLTNNPPFPEQMQRLNDYMSLSPKQPENKFAPDVDLAHYSRGMGAIGLPGDLSSGSMFVRAAFVAQNSKSLAGEKESVSQFFHILGSVEQQRGCCEVADKKYEITIYTSCCNATKGIYYYKTYDCHTIHAVDMRREDLSSSSLISYPAVQSVNFSFQN